jgi:4-hydroxy-4-methyl-2-oxoglutarate aldolase
VFCRGATPRIATAGDRGRARVPVPCGGVVVAPGDLVRGDCDGVIVVPWERLPEVLAAGEAKLAKEREAEKAMAHGGGIELLYGEYLEDEGTS